MAKKKPSARLTTLLRLAQMREEAAARQLGASSAQAEAAQLRAQQLANYEGEYQAQYLQRGSQPMSRTELLNFQGFFKQLEQAQLTQQQALEQRNAERERMRQLWLEQHARRRLLTQIRDRRVGREALDAEKHLQSELDDRIKRQ